MFGRGWLFFSQCRQLEALHRRRRHRHRRRRRQPTTLVFFLSIDAEPLRWGDDDDDVLKFKEAPTSFCSPSLRSSRVPAGEKCPTLTWRSVFEAPQKSHNIKCPKIKNKAGLSLQPATGIGQRQHISGHMGWVRFDWGLDSSKVKMTICTLFQ